MEEARYKVLVLSLNMEEENGIKILLFFFQISSALSIRNFHEKILSKNYFPYVQFHLAQTVLSFFNDLKGKF